MIADHQDTLQLHLANERTMLAWTRTGIALMAFGFAIARFGLFLRQLAALNAASVHQLQGVESTWIGAALVLLGMLVNLSATLRYAQVRSSIARGEAGAPSAVLVYVTGIMATVVGVAMGVLLARTLAE
jgi:inner membrane protein YidH